MESLGHDLAIAECFLKVKSCPKAVQYPERTFNVIRGSLSRAQLHEKLSK